MNFWTVFIPCPVFILPQTRPSFYASVCNDDSLILNTALRRNSCPVLDIQNEGGFLYPFAMRITGTGSIKICAIYMVCKFQKSDGFSSMGEIPYTMSTYFSD